MTRRPARYRYERPQFDRILCDRCERVLARRQHGHTWDYLAGHSPSEARHPRGRHFDPSCDRRLVRDILGRVL